ncbi:MAG: hypothetical protein JXR64_02955 [Spirochaetales bacterium]|nr:hypothetical protein [Spirochaetales bacterium]
MYKTDRVYKLGFKERVTVYELDDIINNEKIELFQGNNEWKGAAENYRYYLHRGRNRTIGSDYRVLKKKALVVKITKLFFKLIMKDILNGEKVRIGTRAFYLYIGQRLSTSSRYVFKASQHGIDYIPYVKLSKLLTGGKASNLMYMTFSDKYQNIFKSNLRKGKKYKG